MNDVEYIHCGKYSLPSLITRLQSFESISLIDCLKSERQYFSKNLLIIILHTLIRSFFRMETENILKPFDDEQKQIRKYEVCFSTIDRMKSTR